MTAARKNVTIAQDANGLDLFTARHRIPMPGQDPQRSEHIFRELCRHFKPQDPIEWMWVNDVAVITSRIEFLRRCHRAATLVSLRREVARAGRHSEEISVQEAYDVRIDIYEDFYDLDKQARSYSNPENLPIVRLLGATSMGSLGREEDFMGLEFTAIRERDRIIAQIGRKRREDMVAAVTVIDAECVGGGHAE